MDTDDFNDAPVIGRMDEPADFGVGDINQTIARIESLKMKVLGNPYMTEPDKMEFFRELDILRAEYMHFSAAGPAPAPIADPVAIHADASSLELEGILGENRIINANLKLIAKVAPTDMTVLLEGETGSGKELFARIVHLNSKREKFVAVNCGAIPPNIIESELYGHVRGAFTGAVHTRKGKFEEAQDGTIFLDEIGDLEYEAQVKLLRVLDLGEIQRVGADVPQKIDIRVIAATNRDLEDMVHKGQFREDLYYRLSMCSLWIPPLRERRDEIEVLFNYFLRQTANDNGMPLAEISDELRVFIYKRYDFPGNIRELKNLTQFIAYIHDGKPVAIQDLPRRYRERHQNMNGSAQDNDEGQLRQVRGSAEKEHLTSVLNANNGDIQAVCADLGLSRSRVYQLLKKHGIKSRDFRG